MQFPLNDRYFHISDLREYFAEKEGFPKIAKRLRAIAVAEKHHEDRYKKLLKEAEGNTVFKKEKKVYWVCRKCGYIYKGKEDSHRGREIILKK